MISLSFAKVKETTFSNTRKKICEIIAGLYDKYDFLLDSGKLNEREKGKYQKVSADMEDYIASDSLNNLSDYLMRYYGKKVILLLDEYDTPMQEAYVHGFWEELVSFIRNLFNASFKTNPYLERAVMTGITRVSKESIFSDLNNLKVVTTTSEQYADCFGFTEEEVFTALDEFGMGEKKEEVKQWYDGFCFGSVSDIYNPWSIINLLDTGKVGLYWAPEDCNLRVAGSRQMSASSHLARCHRENTSANSLVGKLIREGNREVKRDFEDLLKGQHVITDLDEQIVYDQLGQDETAIWSLLVASGYMKVVKHEEVYDVVDYDLISSHYELTLTNLEVRLMFRSMIKGWFAENKADYNDFIKALLLGDTEAMNHYMNRVALTTFSYFDTGKSPDLVEPERFYHGFVLGLMVELNGHYVLTSNRESGFGRYDVLLEPRNQEDDAIILEFKVQSAREKELSDTVESALKQIKEKSTKQSLWRRGLQKRRSANMGLHFAEKRF